ncbi:TetR/AcrR family transcriptional regulator [Salana multivorans]
MPSTTIKNGADTRTRIRAAAAEQFARRGYAGTGLKLVAAEAEAPFGSIYHFFPGGKDELAEDMIRTTGPQFMALVLSVLAEREDPRDALEHCFVTAGERVRAADYADACPIATMALEVASTNDRLRQATAEVFAEWLAAGTAWFEQSGVGADSSGDLAYALIMLTEGAFLLSRAARDVEPLLSAGRSMVRLADAALP